MRFVVEAAFHGHLPWHEKAEHRELSRRELTRLEAIRSSSAGRRFGAGPGSDLLLRVVP